MGSRAKASIGAAFACLLCVATPAAAKIPNGNFEKGNFSNWQRANVDQAEWHVYSSETKSSLGPAEVNAEIPQPRGEFSPVLIQGGPSQSALSRTIRVPQRAKQLRGRIFWHNFNDFFHFEGSYDHTTPNPNQYFSLDLIDGSADPFTVADGDLLANIFAPVSETIAIRARGSIDATPDSSNGWVPFEARLKPFRGDTIGLRLAEVDNEAPMLVGIDDLKIKKKRRR